jgi:hypothetical protein
MEISRIDIVNRNITEYVDYSFKNYTTNINCPEEGRVYRDWFINEFLQACITRWYESSCYDINNMFTTDDFFDRDIDTFSGILQILMEYFNEYDKILDMDKFDPTNVMRCYTSVYVSNNIEYFLDRYEEEYEDLINPRDILSDEDDDEDEEGGEVEESNTTDNISIDLFQPVENNVIISPPSFINVIENDINDVDVDDDATDYEDDESHRTGLVNIIPDDDSDTSSLPALIDYDNEEINFYNFDIYNTRDEEGELYDTGVFVSENEFIEKNRNTECIICWEVVMDYTNSMKWNNCDHFTCISCHNECKNKRLNKCPLCRA